MLRKDQTGESIQGVAPHTIISSAAGVAFDVNTYSILVAGAAYEFYINADSANKITWPQGLPLVRAEGVTSITTTGIVVFAVQ